MTELLPCPFCGGEAEAVHEINGFWTVECVKCGALVDGIEAWNTRYHSEFEKTVIKAWKEIKEYKERTCRVERQDELPYLVCSNCGAIQPEDYTVYFCWSCGAKVVGE